MSGLPPKADSSRTSLRVATKLRQSGISISHMTVARWRSRGWRPLEREQHPLERAREQLDDAKPLLTGDPLTTAKVLVEESAERDELVRLTDRELLRRAARSATTAVSVVGHAFLRQPEAVIYKPGELASYFERSRRVLRPCQARSRKPQAPRPATPRLTRLREGRLGFSAHLFTKPSFRRRRLQPAPAGGPKRTHRSSRLGPGCADRNEHRIVLTRSPRIGWYKLARSGVCQNAE
jgi:hypothetical protein